jgi:hypothetical protein
MSCRKCPHHVRHGHVGADGKSIEFKDRCGLKMKDSKPRDCAHVPFKLGFEYTACEVYLETFKTAGQRNDVVPTSDFQYSDKLQTNSITDMELL